MLCTIESTVRLSGCPAVRLSGCLGEFGTATDKGTFLDLFAPFFQMLLTLGGFATLFTSRNLLGGNPPQFKFSVLQVRQNKDEDEPETAQACSGNGDDNPRSEHSDG